MGMRLPRPLIPRCQPIREPRQKPILRALPVLVQNIGLPVGAGDSLVNQGLRRATPLHFLHGNDLTGVRIRLGAIWASNVLQLVGFILLEPVFRGNGKNDLPGPTGRNPDRLPTEVVLRVKRVEEVGLIPLILDLFLLVQGGIGIIGARDRLMVRVIFIRACFVHILWRSIVRVFYGTVLLFLRKVGNDTAAIAGAFVQVHLLDAELWLVARIVPSCQLGLSGRATPGDVEADATKMAIYLSEISGHAPSLNSQVAVVPRSTLDTS